MVYQLNRDVDVCSDYDKQQNNAGGSNKPVTPKGFPESLHILHHKTVFVATLL